MTAQPIWRKGRRGGFYAEAGLRYADELELETGHDQSSTTVVLTRREVAELAAALYTWLRESPPGRGGVIVDPYEYAQAAAALATARDLTCERDGCGHRMGVHGIGSKPDRPSPCCECLCPRFR